MKFSAARHLFFSVISAGILFGTIMVPGASAQNAADIVAKVKARLDKIGSLSCSFDREHTWKAADRSQHLAGTIRLKNPNKLRVEYSAQTIVSDGKSVWTYTPRNKQVVISSAKGGEAEYPSPQTIFRRYAGRSAEVTGHEAVDGRQTDVIRLAAPSSDEADVTVWVDRALNFPVKTVEKYPNGDRTVSLLTDVIINGRIADGVFTFKAPEGASVVDMRK